MDTDALAHLLTIVQDGVVSRRQILEIGGTDHDIRRMVRRRELVRLHPGVFIDHTGRPTRAQWEFAAVLALWPAALSHESALGLPTPDGRIHIAIPGDRCVRAMHGIRVHRLDAFDARVDRLTTPPRIARAEAVVDCLAQRSADAAFALLGEVVHDGQVGIAQVRAVMARRPRVAQRRLIGDLLDDLETGACSVLERGYLHLVERPHRLPPVDRQTRERLAGRTVVRDGRWATYGLVLELDGRAYHDGPLARTRDSVRDLLTLAGRDEATVRITFHQVYGRACETAALIATVLGNRGWPGRVRRCPRCP